MKEKSLRNDKVFKNRFRNWEIFEFVMRNVTKKIWEREKIKKSFQNEFHFTFKNLKSSLRKNGTFAKQPSKKVLGYQGFGEGTLLVEWQFT